MSGDIAPSSIIEMVAPVSLVPTFSVRTSALKWYHPAASVSDCIHRASLGLIALTSSCPGASFCGRIQVYAKAAGSLTHASVRQLSGCCSDPLARSPLSMRLASVARVERAVAIIRIAAAHATKAKRVPRSRLIASDPVSESRALEPNARVISLPIDYDAGTDRKVVNKQYHRRHAEDRAYVLPGIVAS